MASPDGCSVPSRTMSPAPSHVARAPERELGITVGLAAVAWMVSWSFGNVLGVALLGVIGVESSTVTPTWAVVVGALPLWVAMMTGVWWSSRLQGTGSVVADIGIRFAPADVLGIPLGIAAQLGLLRLLYWPLQSIWPGTFAQDRVEDSARTLYDNAHGFWLVMLVVVVVVGAPIVEESVYRGLLQGSFVRRFGKPVGVVVVAAWFALVHFRPIEYPGLFVFGLLVGLCAVRTGRLGLGIVTHFAFNAAGLITVARR